jgi:hypothetical protein
LTVTQTTPTAPPGDIWWSADQRDIDTKAVSLLGHPDVVAARAAATERFRKSTEFSVPDAPATLAYTVDDLLFSCLQIAVISDPSRPKVLWTVRRPYSADGRHFPGSHYGGDNPDRVYRMIGVNSSHRYRITGRRHPTHPSEDDLSFEAIPAPGLYGQPLVRLARGAIDIAEDGSFSVTADRTGAAGRRNHLELPPDANMIVVRDTLVDWASQVPNEVTVEILDGPALPVRSDDDVARAGAEIFGQCVTMTLAFLDNTLHAGPVNQALVFQRPVKWGMAGSLFSANRFAVADDEALMVTLDPLSAKYLVINACDPWTRAIPYDTHWSSLNNVQAQPNSDGTYTFVLSPRDPGVHNWLDTGGLHAGTFTARWELITDQPATTDPESGDDKSWSAGTQVVEQAVREARVLPVADVAAHIPAGQSRVTPEQRQLLIAARRAHYEVRVTGVVPPTEN